ncbi:MAG: hypothetical protein KJN92_10640, partial [Gemmatimonadetes bacterium]|nr:hypothetical protein [Gemmatimonadota bacterium]
MRGINHRILPTWVPFVLGLVGCQGRPPDQSSEPSPASVAFAVYDAGETLALLPVASRLRPANIDIRWVPLTPWAADLLEANGQAYHPLPDDIQDMPYVDGSRTDSADISYWVEGLLEDPPDLVVSGMVSTVQGQVGAELREARIVTRGYHDGFQPPDSTSISAQVAGAFAAIWVPTARVQEGYRTLGIEAVVAGQPSLEAWRRAATEVDAAEVRQIQGVGTGSSVLLFAGQYGEGYEEALAAFLSSVRGSLSADSNLLLILSHHPRTDGTLERRALEEAAISRAVMALEGIPTME